MFEINKVIIFRDENLHKALNEIITGHESLDDINESQMADLPGVIDLSNKKISDLTGMEYAVNLISLDISNNLIDNLNPTSEITLYKLNASNNNISDISKLNINIEQLFLDNNKIKNISRIANLTLLTGLSLENNLIEDISPLYGISRIISDENVLQLVSLDLSQNKIKDISYLNSDLEGIAILDNQDIVLNPKYLKGDKSCQLELNGLIKNFQGYVPTEINVKLVGKVSYDKVTQIISWRNIDILTDKLEFSFQQNIEKITDFYGDILQEVAITIPDKNLLRAINEILGEGRYINTPVTKEDLDKLPSYLNLSGKGVYNLEGLQYLDEAKVTSIDINANHLISLEPIRRIFGVISKSDNQYIIYYRKVISGENLVFDISFLEADGTIASISNISAGGVKEGKTVKWSNIISESTLTFNYSKSYNPILSGTVRINISILKTRGIKLF